MQRMHLVLQLVDLALGLHAHARGQVHHGALRVLQLLHSSAGGQVLGFVG